MFVDASALVAIIVRDTGGYDLADRLQRAHAPITSPLAVYEAVLGIGRVVKGGLRAARADVGLLLKEAGIRIVPVTPEDADRAWMAFERYGKGSGHPARLNMGDCFAYALAQGHGVPLLYKGDGFSKTDLG